MNEELPYSGGVVTAKILRLAECHAVARKNRLKKKQNYEKNPNLFAAAAAATPSVPPKKDPVRASPVEPRSVPSPVAAPSPAPHPQTAPPSSSSSPIERKPSFDFFQTDAPPSPPAPRPASAPSAPGIVVDDIDDDAPAPAAAALSREELRARREANVQERVQEALKFKQEVNHHRGVFVVVFMCILVGREYAERGRGSRQFQAQARQESHGNAFVLPLL